MLILRRTGVSPFLVRLPRREPPRIGGVLQDFFVKKSDKIRLNPSPTSSIAALWEFFIAISGSISLKNSSAGSIQRATASLCIISDEGNLPLISNIPVYWVEVVFSANFAWLQPRGCRCFFRFKAKISLIFVMAINLQALRHLSRSRREPKVRRGIKPDFRINQGMSDKFNK